MTQQFIIQGRIVFGNPAKPRIKKDVRTKQPVLKDGQQVQQYVFGVAIDKNTFAQQVWPFLYNEARAAFPNGIPQNFSYKYKDGDGVDSKGQPFSTREGYAGHCVLTISTEGFAPNLYKQENGQWVQMPGEQIKCGDYVAVNVTIKYNGAVSPNTPGLYVNPNGVLFLGYGQEIVSAGQDPDELFGHGFQAQQFAGMSAQPLMGNAPLPAGMAAPAAAPAQQYGQPAMPAQPAMHGQPPMQPSYNAAPAAAPAQLPPPAHDFVQSATGQPMAPAPQYGAPAPQHYAPAQPMNAGQPPAPVAAGYAPQPVNPAMAYPSNPAMPAQPAQPGQFPGMPAPR